MLRDAAYPNGRGTRYGCERMSIGASLILIAVGAILKYAVTASVSGIDLATVGVILMVVGIIGLAVSLVYLGVLSDRRRGEVVRDREIVRDRDRF